MARKKNSAVSTTAVRNTPIPKSSPTVKDKDVSHDQIAKRAYEISQQPGAGSEMDNWLRAERELKNR